MNNGDLPARPITLPSAESYNNHCPHDGLTKREDFAKTAMQGILAGHLADGKELNDWSYKCLAERSVKMADGLLDELERTQ